MQIGVSGKESACQENSFRTWIYSGICFISNFIYFQISNLYWRSAFKIKKMPQWKPAENVFVDSFKLLNIWISDRVLQVQVSVGEKMIAAYATGTAVLLSALPPAPEIALATHSRVFLSHQKSIQRLDEVSKLIDDTLKQNKIHYQLVEVCAA